MDIVNSVTQNSNNRNVTMENQGGGGVGGSGGSGGSSGGDDEWNKQNNDDSSSTKQQLSPSSADGKASSGSSNQMPDYLKAIGMDPRKFWPKKYRFTREKSPGQHNPLTIAQRNFYETNGYIVFDDCVPKKLLDSIRNQHLESGNASLVSEFLLEKLLMKNRRLIPYVKCFCDERLMLMTHRLIDNFQEEQTNQQTALNNNNNNNYDYARKELIDQNRQPRQLLFRDWVYLPFRPIDKVCCAITAIEPMEHVLLVVPGTHRVGQVTISSTLDNISAAYDSSQEKAGQGMRREIFECSPEKLSTLVEKSKKGFKYINLKPGQTLFYHPGLIHGFSNDLVNFRKNQLVSIAYYAAADCEYVDLRKSSPELIQDSRQEQVPIGLAHFKDKDPRDYTSWLDKPKLLSDERANL
uniref:phytanoyl-CoA dioxygenase n=1 Tax=Aceria tosichella TaxID=561515 RepID=A0A6G1S4M8_9ACAR